MSIHPTQNMRVKQGRPRLKETNGKKGKSPTQRDRKRNVSDGEADKTVERAFQSLHKKQTARIKSTHDDPELL